MTTVGSTAPSSVDSLSSRETQIEQLSIAYPLFTHALEEIGECQRRSKFSSEAKCMLVIGWPGAGKSTLAKTYLDRHPRVERPDGDTVPVVYKEVPSTGKEGSLARCILEALGEQYIGRQTVDQTTRMLRRKLQMARTELIILDESQHVIDRDSERVIRSLADWIKLFIDQTGIPIIIMGTPECEAIFKINEQLRRRVIRRIDLKPFNWHESADQTEFQQFLHRLDNKLPFPTRAGLAAPELTFRCYQASSGLVGAMVKIVKEAAYFALREGSGSVTTRHLATGFKEAVQALFPSMPNPFVTGFSLTAAPVEAGLLGKRTGEIRVSVTRATDVLR